MLLEIAVFNYVSAIQAANAGADRLEVCTNYAEGGTTASYGMLKLIRQNIQLPIFAIIRPRGGNFVYTQQEFSAMQQDIIVCKNLGYDGVVLGSLNEDNTVHVEQTKKLVNLAYPLEVTFHRAFDRVNNKELALEQIIDAGCTRILTSGSKKTAIESVAEIAELVELANERIVIVPGGGLRSEHINTLIQQTNTLEFHSSAITNFTNENIMVDANEILAIKTILNSCKKNPPKFSRDS
jgi:copper homeostasis protein